MANNSSSSSSSFDSSSSSSFGYTSSSSSHSSSSSSESSNQLSSSSSSTDSSSSSSLDSSSSSSSSYLDLSDNRMLPFTYSRKKDKSIWSIAFDSTHAYAGTSDDGMIIRSSDRSIWGSFHRLDDTWVSSLLVNGTTLFAGTSPHGKVYRISLADESVTLDKKLDGPVVDFVYYKSEIYFASSNPPLVHKYNVVQKSWDEFYKPSAKKINQMTVAKGKMWLSLDAENSVSYDGDSWTIEIYNPNNIASQRRVSKNVYSYTNYDFVNSDSDSLSNEDTLDIFPYNRLIGVSNIVEDGETITVGGKNHGRVFNYNNGELKPIFETDTTGVQALLNLSLGVNLAAMDNKLYLVHCGDISATETEVEENTVDPNKDKTVVIKSPNGGETLIIGTEIEISWSSTRSVNDGIKLSLYKSGEEVLVITNKTSNDGIYLWNVPLTLSDGEDYKMYIEWISATDNVSSTDQDFSDQDFSIFVSEPEVSTVESLTVSEGVPDISQCRGIPIIHFDSDEKIVYMTKDIYKGGVLFTTSLGRILYADEVTLNAYLTGEGLIYADVTNGFGKTSDLVAKNFLYALYKRIFEINEGKEIKKWKYVKDVSAIPTDSITAHFLSPILQADEDIGFWKELSWTENKPDNTKITVCVKSGNTTDELEGSSWDLCFRSTSDDSSTITRELNNVSLTGRFAQIKVIMRTDTKDITPKVTNVNLVYSSKRAQYFYTVKFSLESESNLNKGLLTGTISEPTNTEILFGYNASNSSNWDDYTIIDRDELFDLPDIDNVKIGIKMISYDESLPVVDEFGIMFGGDKTEKLNN